MAVVIGASHQPQPALSPRHWLTADRERLTDGDQVHSSHPVRRSPRRDGTRMARSGRGLAGFRSLCRACIPAEKINSQGQKRDPISELFKALGLEMGHNPLGDSYDKELGFEHSPSNQPLPESRKQRIGLPFRFQRPVNHNGILLAIKPMK